MKIAVAMSGGVDSSVVAKMMVDQGNEVIGLFLKLWSDPSCSTSCDNRCCDEEALWDARAVAKMIGIPFYVINARDEFKREIVDCFLDEYKNLRTPNPCIKCNEKIKFELLLKKALSLGCDKLATGHYARISWQSAVGSRQREGNRKLLKGIDSSKDQSYMLYRLNQKQLSRVLFPLGEMTKKEVRALAESWNLPVKEKPESQEICFVRDKDFRDFLRRYLSKNLFKKGQIVNTEGEIMGEHEGLINYTIGQRKGFNLSDKNEAREPLYVSGFDKKKNRLIVGSDKETFADKMRIKDLHLVSGSGSLIQNPRLSVKIRYRHPAIKIKQLRKSGNKFEVEFAKSVRAITPGQSAVFYLGDEVLGGGIIE